MLRFTRTALFESTFLKHPAVSGTSCSFVVLSLMRQTLAMVLALLSVRKLEQHAERTF